MTSHNDPMARAVDWLERLVRENGPDADLAHGLLAELDELDGLLDEKGEQIDGIIENFGGLEDIRRDLEDYRNIRESCEAAEIIDEDADDEPLDPLLRMFLPVS